MNIYRLFLLFLALRHSQYPTKPKMTPWIISEVESDLNPEGSELTCRKMISDIMEI